MKLFNIKIEDLPQANESNAIPNLYLSRGNFVQLFLEREASFIFNGYSLCLCLAGSCDLSIDGRKYHITADSLLLLPPNHLVEFQNRSDDFIRRSVFFSLDFLIEFPSPLDIDTARMASRQPVLHLPASKTKHILDYYNILKDEYEEVDNPFRKTITKTILNVIILEVLACYKMFIGEIQEEQQHHETLSDDFFLLLSMYYKKERNATFYAEKMNMTPKYLSKKIKDITGRSIHEWLNEMLITEIKVQLKTSDQTILQISEELNFSSPSVFVQFFKHHTGMTPLKYKKDA